MLAAPSLSHAGLGDLMKKAKEKAQQAVAPKPSSPEATVDEKPVFDEVTVELTPERLDHIVAAFESAAEAGTGRPALVEKLNQARDERNKLMEKNEQAIIAVRNKRGDLEVCYHDGYHEISDRKMKDYSQRALSDPALRDKYAKAAAKYNAAAAQGDSTAIAKLNEIMMGEMLPSPADSAEVRKKCGPMPPLTAAEQKLLDLDKQTASHEEQIRAIDDKVAEAQAKTGGLTPQQWGKALERIQAFLATQKGNGGGSGGGNGGGGRKGKADKGASSSESGSSSSDSGSGATSVRGYSKIEVEALEARMEKLRKYMG